jgi:hypothetical protein
MCLVVSGNKIAIECSAKFRNEEQETTACELHPPQVQTLKETGTVCKKTSPGRPAVT